MVECSAEPSALAGVDGGTRLRGRARTSSGAYNCLELCPPRRRPARVPLDEPRLPVRRADALAYREGRPVRARPTQPCPGASADGHRRELPARRRRERSTARRSSRPSCSSPSTLETFGLRAVVDRCGVIAGPMADGQGRPGRFHLLDARPLLRSATRATSDTAATASRCGPAARGRSRRADRGAARGPSAGAARRQRGRRARVLSLSCSRLTELCPSITGNRSRRSAERVDRATYRIYISDCAALFAYTDWRPRSGPRAMLEDTAPGSLTNERARREALD